MGRKAEMKFYLDWSEGTKTLISKSQALLSRRKKGKTALVQRLFNILYTNNDPQIIPFFFRIPERRLVSADFGLIFYRTFLSQYLGFRLRKPALMNNPLSLKGLKDLAGDDLVVKRDIETMEEILTTSRPLAWDHAQAAPHRLATLENVRIIQIIDEFQYMNRYIYDDYKRDNQIDLCHAYMGLAESKYAPLIVTGSYIGWLTTILNYMTARFEERQLGNLAPDEALATAYNYAGIMKQPVIDETASYIAEVAYNDPFYISQIIRTQKPDLDLTTKAGVRDALQFETTLGKGFVAKVWMEYVAEGLTRMNDVNGKKNVLYLAKHGSEERSLDQIQDDLKLDLTVKELKDRLFMLTQADLIAPGSNDYHFKGLGDPIFAVTFRKQFSYEIERVGTQQVTDEFEEEMIKARRQTIGVG